MGHDAPTNEKQTSDLKAIHPVRRWILTASLAFALICAAVLGCRLIYHQAKIWRAEQLAQEASVILGENGNLSQAEAKLIAAYNLAPRDANVIRYCARYMAASNPSRAWGFYRLLLSLPQATVNDRREATSACLAFGDLVTAETLANELAHDTGTAEDFALQGQVQWRLRQPNEALSTLRHALSLNKDAPAIRLLLAEILLGSSGTEGTTEAINLLKDLSKEPSQEGLKALNLLARNRGLGETDRREVLERLRSHPLIDDNGRMTAWELESRLDPENQEAVLRKAITYFKSKTIATRAQAGRWLYDLGKPELALELASLEDSRQSQDLFQVREDSLANLGRWTEVKEELGGGSVPLPSYLIDLYQARCAAQLGSAAESEADWAKARDDAAGEHAALAELVRYAAQLGLYVQARQTLIRMTQLTDGAHESYLMLLQLEAGQSNSADLLNTLQQMMSDFPSDPEPKNDWAYLSLLLDQNVQKASEIAEVLVQDDPKSLGYRSTLALARLRQHNPQGAAQIYEGFQIDWSQYSPSWRMIYATVLAAEGKKVAGLRLVRDIRRDQLRPAELAYFNSCFTSK